MKNRNLSTSHLSIVQYWRDKAITKDGEVIIDNENSHEGSVSVIYDIGEPECWACGRLVEDIYKYQNYENLLEENPMKLWGLSASKSFLNRCHIIPHSAGGEDKPENLFLLCERCHVEAPDTDNSKNFLKWVYKRRKNGKFVNGYDFTSLINDFITDCKEKGKDPKTVKTGKAKIYSHGGKYSQSTISMALADTCDDIK